MPPILSLELNLFVVEVVLLEAGRIGRVLRSYTRIESRWLRRASPS